MKRKEYITGLVMFVLGLFNSGIASDIANDSLSFTIDDTVITDFNRNLDSLAELEFMSDTATIETTEFVEIDSTTGNFSSIPDSVFIKRLSEIQTVVDLAYNKIVRRYIEVYITERKEIVANMLGMADYYFPIFDDIFDYYDVPNEMKYMSIIESALNPRAVSRAGAVGLWQFMYGTGKYNGLTINSLVDERRDPVKSTYAAAKYAKQLYNIYGDWLMVIAAYNCGPGNVNKAIRRSGGKRNYWEIYYYLPRETRGHVPAFIAATYVMNYYHEHGLTANKINLPPVNDTIMVLDKLHLKQVSEVLDISLDLVRDLNPQYRADIIPGSDKTPYSLRLPEDKILSFIENEKEVFTYKDSVFFNPANNINKPAYYASSRYYHVPPGDNYSKLYYTVKQGDNLGFISEWYGVGLSDVKRWNNLRGNTIRVGQRLVIYEHKNVVNKYKNINSMSFAEKQRTIGKTVSVNTASNTNNNINSGEYVMYTVRYGDTVWDIAKKFPGVSDSDILRLNNLTHNSKIVPGQQLKIKKKI